jgi:hypothetical protein
MKFGSDTHLGVRRLEEGIAFRLPLQGNCGDPMNVSGKPQIHHISHESGMNVTY